MGASNFLVFYGLRFDLTDADLSPYERRESVHQVAARENGLDTWWGITREESYFLLLGTSVGNFGWEYMADGSIDDATFADTVANTKAKLRAAGYTDPPALHFQFEPDF